MKYVFVMIIVLVQNLYHCEVTAQSEEAQQLLLNVEKLAQFRKILQDMKKGYQILTQGYNQVKAISEGNFNLHKTFLDALMEVSPTVRKYKRVSDIISNQLMIVKEYKIAISRFKRDDHFTAAEIDYIEAVYSNLFKSSLKNLESLTMVVTANKLRMSDHERLAAIDNIHNDTQQKLMFLRNFNNNTLILALQRAKEENDIDAARDLYGIKK
jgi:DNA repair ATPase RecN